jgi:uncharacterized membrane protein YbaN (DUF454 family)
MNSRLEPRQINTNITGTTQTPNESILDTTAFDEELAAKELVIENSNRVIRICLIIAGTICLGLGLVGIILPILPTTPFLLLAAACYGRGSRRAYHWLMHNRLFGTHLKNYREGKGMALWPKVGTIFLLCLTIGYTSLVLIPILYVKAVLLLIALGVTIHLLRIPTTRNKKA